MLFGYLAVTLSGLFGALDFLYASRISFDRLAGDCDALLMLILGDSASFIEALRVFVRLIDLMLPATLLLTCL
jgi:hypothetical protein